MKIHMGTHPIGGLGVPHKDCYCRNCEAARPKLTVPRRCTCHPDEAPVPCQRQYALSDCVAAAQCDDREVMRLWRECGLPEYFLGNGGSNHKLVEFARRIRAGAA